VISPESGPLILLTRHYDRTSALEDGHVLVGGRPARFQIASPPATFKRLSEDPAVTAGEMSLGFHTALMSSGASRFVGVPVYLSRSFRHGNVFVRKDSPLEDFSQLAGSRIGLEEYAMTLAVWIRGLFSEAGVTPESIRWFTARDPVVTSEVEGRLRRTLDLTRVAEGSTWTMLADGELDVVLGRPPDVRDVRDGQFRRLLPSHGDAQRQYYRDTGIFPIMHVLVVRREAYEANPAIVSELYQAFAESKRFAIEDLRANLHTLSVTLPLLEAHVDETCALFGSDWWPYGFKSGAVALSKFLDYSLEQGLITGELEPAQLFSPETLET
jgi:4,5-dihydroxyphthalate decarboxylase